MTNYNDGKWHGWNGGECPVHLQSAVQIVWQFADGSIRDGAQISLAGEWAWLGNDHGSLIAFRVVKEHREPREFWNVGMHSHVTLVQAEEFLARLKRDNPQVTFGPIIHVREVLE